MMNEWIATKLNEIETEQGISILFAVEAGSRAWGIASTTSDYDIRFLFVRTARDYLSLEPKGDVIALPVTDRLDLHGWDIQKALRLLQRSNPSLLEWLHSPIVYRERGETARRMREIAREQVSLKKLMLHYLQIARKNVAASARKEEELLVKRRLNIAKPLLCLTWIEQQGMIPPVQLQQLINGISWPHEVRTAVEGWIRDKQQGERTIGESEYEGIDRWIAEELNRIAKQADRMEDRIMDVKPLNEILWNILKL